MRCRAPGRRCGCRRCRWCRSARRWRLADRPHALVETAHPHQHVAGEGNGLGRVHQRGGRRCPCGRAPCAARRHGRPRPPGRRRPRPRRRPGDEAPMSRAATPPSTHGLAQEVHARLVRRDLAHMLRHDERPVFTQPSCRKSDAVSRVGMELRLDLFGVERKVEDIGIGDGESDRPASARPPPTDERALLFSGEGMPPLPARGPIRAATCRTHSAPTMRRAQVRSCAASHAGRRVPADRHPVAVPGLFPRDAGRPHARSLRFARRNGTVRTGRDPPGRPRGAGCSCCTAASKATSSPPTMRSPPCSPCAGTGATMHSILLEGERALRCTRGRMVVRDWAMLESRALRQVTRAV